MIDVHAHLCFPQFDKVREKVAAECGKRMEAVIVSSARYDEGLCALKLTEGSGKLFPTLGFHPTEGGNDPDRIISLIRDNRDRVVGIGEVGLDYHWEKVPERRGGQKEVLRRFIDLAEELGKPLIIHSWDAERECFELVKGFPETVIFHCYSGPRELAEKIVKAGFFVSFSTQILFSKNHRKLAKAVPLRQMLLETDAPFLSPYRHLKSQGIEPPRDGFDHALNYPWNVRLAAEKIAAEKKVGVPEVLGSTARNAKAIFGLE
jgi:TatD DNase family protein